MSRICLILGLICGINGDNIWSSLTSECIHNNGISLSPLNDNIVYVSDVYQLYEALSEMNNHTTVYIRPGTYNIDYLDTDRLEIQISHEYTNDIVIRGLSGNRDDVIIHGINSKYGIYSVSTSNLIIADITLQGFGVNNIHISTNISEQQYNTYVTNITLHNLNIMDAGNDLVYLNGVDSATIEYCLFQKTDAWEEAGLDDTLCVGNGITVENGNHLIIQDNSFKNLYCNSESNAQRTIKVASQSYNPVIQRNTFLNCAFPIEFHNSDGIIEVNYGKIINNFYFRSYGIKSSEGAFYSSSPNSIIAHNNIYIANININIRPILVRFRNTKNVTICNNILQSNLDIISPFVKSATGISSHNVFNAELNWFVDPNVGDLHLIWESYAVYSNCKNKGIKLLGIDYDIDNRLRDNGIYVDIGAEEYNTQCRSIKTPAINTTNMSDNKIDNNINEMLLMAVVLLIVAISIIVTCVFCYFINYDNKTETEEPNEENEPTPRDLPELKPSLYSGVHSDSIPDGFEDLAARKSNSQHNNDPRRKYYGAALPTGHSNSNLISPTFTNDIIHNDNNNTNINNNSREEGCDLNTLTIHVPNSDDDYCVSSDFTCKSPTTTVNSASYFERSDH